MAKIYFHGKVFPKNLELSIPSEAIQWNESGTSWVFSIFCNKGDITVECAVDPYSASDIEFSEAFRRAHDLTKASFGILSFATGLGLTVILDEHTDVQRNRFPILHDAQHLAAHCTVAAPGIERTYREILTIILAEPALLFALNDLVESISTPHASAANCARVVEGLRQLISKRKETKEQWLEMHSFLNLSQTYLHSITENSKEVRHGNRVYIPPSTAWEVLNRSWVVMNRFLEFRKRGNIQLPTSDFPILR